MWRMPSAIRLAWYTASYGLLWEVCASSTHSYIAIPILIIALCKALS